MVLLFFLLFGFIANTKAMWADESPYCHDTEPLAPNGVVLRMGERYYRTCGLWSDNMPWRQFRLDMNPDLIPDLYSRYSPTNLSVYENVDGIDRMANQMKPKIATGTRFFGGLEYQSHESKVIGPNGKRSSGIYIFFPKEGDQRGIPEHWVNCAGWGRIRSDTLTCHVQVNVGAVVGTLLFIGSDQRGFDFVEHFPAFAQDIVRVLEVADVTDELDDLEGEIDIVE
ncbi:hypothetical protein K3727_03090 [Rhodobacteraceae bacterium M382]|nr:hypothetical protein K3727_03090 [Rhodobacteraceae bacterium M382]